MKDVADLRPYKALPPEFWAEAGAGQKRWAYEMRPISTTS
jgi:hypothetical protein